MGAGIAFRKWCLYLRPTPYVDAVAAVVAAVPTRLPILAA
jgi:hypothetical protein